MRRVTEDTHMEGEGMSDRLRARPLGRTFAGLVAFAALAGLILASTGSTANRPDLTLDAAGPATHSSATKSGGPQVLMVQLAGNPVTVAVAKSTMKLGSPQADTLQAELASKQDALKGSIVALGGRVLSDF